jgi:hypothetical protein
MRLISVLRRYSSTDGIGQRSPPTTHPRCESESRGSCGPKGPSTDLGQGEPKPAVLESAIVVDSDDAAMLEAGRELSFYEKPGMNPWRTMDIEAQDFGGNGAAELPIEDRPYLPKAAATDEVQVFIAVGRRLWAYGVRCISAGILTLEGELSIAACRDDRAWRASVALGVIRRPRVGMMAGFSEGDRRPRGHILGWHRRTRAIFS